MPNDVVVIRLNPFDFARQQKCIENWNQKNQFFFADPARNIRPFELPKDWNIRELASEPLSTDDAGAL